MNLLYGLLKEETKIQTTSFNTEKNLILVLDVNLHFLCGQFCSTADNYQFLKGMKNFVGKSGHKLKICYQYMNRGDRWMQVKAMQIIEQQLRSKNASVFGGTTTDVSTILYLCQDELEFGYIDSPHQRFPVVLDSPRDGKLQDFPYKELLVRDTMNSSAQNDTPDLEPTISQGLIQKRLKYTVLFSGKMA